MGIRFRKSFSFGKLLKLNVGKSGITSVSIGIPGLRQTLGRKRRTTTIGIPGTGISYVRKSKRRK